MPAPAPRTASLWFEEAMAAEGGGAVAAGLQGSEDADVCIVGGGYTGLWTALRIAELEPGASVAVVERDLCGAAASGRNGGLALSWWPKIESLIARVGEADAFQLARASERAVAELGRFFDAAGMDVHYRRAGWLWTATAPAQVGAWAGVLRTCARGGDRPFVELGAAECARRLGSGAHLAGVFEQDAATVQPALVARGLRRLALDRGVRIFERSPMVALDRDRGVVRTAEGEVRAAAIVLATNAWAAQVPQLRRALLPLSSDVVATEPVPELLAEIGWTGGECASNSKLMVDYYRTTRDGRIVFGRGGGGLAFRGRFGTRFDYDAGRIAATVADLGRLVPGAGAARITHAWGGAVDRSTDGLPFFGTLPGRSRVLYGAGLSGNGIVPTRMAGRILASVALGRDDEWSASPLNRGVPDRFPPEPLLFLGGHLVRRAVQRKERREDAGRGVDRLTRRLAAQAPSGFFKMTAEEDR